jgi:GNAT superfamily N-acetyltransferase
MAGSGLVSGSLAERMAGDRWPGAAHLCALPFPGGAHLLAPEVLVLHAQSFDLAAAGLPIRRLSAADLAACVELAADRGWPPELNKLRLLFAVGEAYGVDDPAGGLAAMVVLTRYGRQLAAVGTMVVASRFGRRGLGRRLMSYLLEQAGPAVVYLGANSRSSRARCFRAWGSAASTPSPGTRAGSLRSRMLPCPARFAPPRCPTASRWPRWTGRYSVRIAGTC